MKPTTRLAFAATATLLFSCAMNIESIQEKQRHITFDGIIIQYNPQKSTGQIRLKGLKLNRSLLEQKSNDFINQFIRMSESNKLLTEYFQISNVHSVSESFYLNSTDSSVSLEINFANDGSGERDLFDAIFSNFTGYFNKTVLKDDILMTSFICRKKLKFSYPENEKAAVSVYTKPDPSNPQVAILWKRADGPYNIGIYGLYSEVGFASPYGHFNSNTAKNKY